MDAISALNERAATVAQVMVPRLLSPVLTNDDLHHVEKVLRVRDKERISLIDGKGSWRIGTWSSEAGTALGSGDIHEGEAKTPAIAVAFSPLKGDRNELVVQKLTELGVDCIQLITADRTVVKWKDTKLEKQMERLRRIAYEASMQSRRLTLPTLDEPISVSEALEQGYCLTSWGGKTMSIDKPKIAIGPEGGWTPVELALCKNPVTLGTNILRSETAAITAGALLSCARG